ncbi:alpha/beta hydrolase [Clostridium sp. MSJ-4]|uniref:Alpha/beta hydrolase n=1 Tax=Clostridium simiarum TaxID=2841506 RepID=A0ABS6F369_9CLOT|nr:alpha/beta hydrolase [Clostridium simiarum]MBU5592924.1 alpha/beta hydrolase [Clostridium simiarum]
MNKVTIGEYELNYECYGEGEPVIFLNGIMMSSLSWRPFIEHFRDNKVIFLDLIDQGSSSKGKESYTQELHVDMLNDFLDKLSIKKAHILGISYGGEVAMRFALKYPKRLLSLILANTTSYTTEIMRGIEKLWDYAAGTYDGEVFFNATMPYIYSHKFYEENAKWLKVREELIINSFKKEWYEGFRRAIKSASDLNVTNRLQEIHVPTFIIGAEYDIITPVIYQEIIHKGIKDSSMVVIKESGHASMYEKPIEFATLVSGFLRNYNKNIRIL